MIDEISLESFHRFVQTCLGTTASLCLERLRQPTENELLLLTEAERKKLTTYKLEKRRNEWFTGRLAAKKCLEQFWAATNIKHTLQPINTIEISNRPDGRPHIGSTVSTFSQLDVSISHSREYAIAMVANTPCGIDIQKTEKTLLRVEERFCTADELSILQQLGHPSMLLLAQLWAAKEAIQKAISITGIMPGFLELLLTGIAQKEGFAIFNIDNIITSQKVLSCTVAVGLFNNYAIACCTTQNHTPSK